MTEYRYQLRGEIDLATAPALRADLQRATSASALDLVIDCRDLAFIDSRGIVILLEAQRDLASRGHGLVIVNVASGPRHAFETLGLGDLLQDEPQSARTPTRVPSTGSRRARPGNALR